MSSVPGPSGGLQLVLELKEDKDKDRDPQMYMTSLVRSAMALKRIRRQIKQKKASAADSIPLSSRFASNLRAQATATKKRNAGTAVTRSIGINTSDTMFRIYVWSKALASAVRSDVAPASTQTTFVCAAASTQTDVRVVDVPRDSASPTSPEPVAMMSTVGGLES